MEALTAHELEAVLRYLEALNLTIGHGPLPAPTVDELCDMGLGTTEAREYVDEWDQDAYDKQWADTVTRRDGLVKLLAVYEATR